MYGALPEPDLSRMVIPRDSLYVTMHRTDDAVRQGLLWWQRLTMIDTMSGATALVTAEDAAAYMRFRSELHAAQRNLRDELVEAVAQWTRQDRQDVAQRIPEPVMLPPYTGRGSAGLAGLGAPPPPIPPQLIWAIVALGAVAIIAGAVTVCYVVGSSIDTVGAVIKAYLQGKQHADFTAQKVSAIQQCMRTFSGRPVEAQQCIDAIHRLEPPPLLLEPERAGVPWYVWGTVAVVVLAAGGGAFVYFQRKGKGTAGTPRPLNTRQKHPGVHASAPRVRGRGDGELRVR